MAWEAFGRRRELSPRYLRLRHERNRARRRRVQVRGPRESSMRLLLGIILGVLITVGAAYLYDSSHAAGTTTAAADQRPLVNWDVVGAKWDTLTHRARTEWARLAG